MKNYTLLKMKRSLNDLAEIGWEERKTTQYIEETIFPQKPLQKGFGEAKTGLLYRVGKGKRAILLRADIDALQTKSGPRHTCGHSTHTAALMSTLQECIKNEKQLTTMDKSIYFLFQPSEESYPSGARAVLKEAPQILPSLSAAFAAHVQPLLPLRTLGLKKGELWARGDYMEIEIEGKMVHIKDAGKGRDALEAAAYIILAIKAIQKKLGNKARINIGVAKGGLQANTVADKAVLTGDIRLIHDYQQAVIKDLLSQKIAAIEKKTKTKIKLIYYDGYPTVRNDPKLTQEIKEYFKKDARWNIEGGKSLFSFGCEDFCFFSQKIPSVMALIGTGDTHDIHEENCTISDEGTLSVYSYFKNIIQWWIEKS